MSRLLYQLSYAAMLCRAKKLRRLDSNQRPLGYEPNELPLLHAAKQGYQEGASAT